MRGGDDTRTTGPHWDPAGQVPFPRSRPRGTCLDQRDRRQHDALPTGCSPAARLGGPRTDHSHESPPSNCQFWR
eukprot:7165184-Pyramimonas_sp.AAC.1